MKLLIGVPTTDYMHADFVRCLADLCLKLQSDRVDFKLFINAGSLAHVARDKIASKAINEEFTHVLWLDSDMVFTPELLDDLQFSGKPFVTAVCCSRRKPYVSCIFSNLDDINHLKRFEDLPHEPFEVQGCGFACVLMETEILRHVMMTEKGTCFLPMKEYGEDLAFCLRARRLGHKIYADPMVRVGHIGHDVYYYPDANENFLRGVDANGK